MYLILGRYFVGRDGLHRLKKPISRRHFWCPARRLADRWAAHAHLRWSQPVQKLDFAKISWQE